jgi:hypothetical protein
VDQLVISSNSMTDRHLQQQLGFSAGRVPVVAMCQQQKAKTAEYASVSFTQTFSSD